MRLTLEILFRREGVGRGDPFLLGHDLVSVRQLLLRVPKDSASLDVLELHGRLVVEDLVEIQFEHPSLCLVGWTACAHFLAL